MRVRAGGGDATLRRPFKFPILGKRVTVGLMAVIFPGCRIGDDAVIAAGAILAKGTVVPPGEVWGGVPAAKIGERRKKGEKSAG